MAKKILSKWYTFQRKYWTLFNENLQLTKGQISSISEMVKVPLKPSIAFLITSVFVPRGSYIGRREAACIIPLLPMS
jgi:hypothetical protein